jgi:polar amino acid transport system ATP-binding protein
MPAAIDFQNVTKSFGTTEVIRGVNLSIESGSVTVICGPSGSGKSTLIRMINRLESPSSGKILVGGKSSTAAKGEALREIRAGIGFVFQQWNLYSHLNALDNVSLAPRKVLRMGKAEAELEAMRALAQVGLAEKALSLPRELSGGQQQRVAIARAIVMKPRVLLFDEPTSALDPEMIGEVLAVIQELAHRGYTLVIVTHEMGFARTIADRVIFLDEGLVAADSDPDSFFEDNDNPRVRRFLSQVLSPLHAAVEA